MNPETLKAIAGIIAGIAAIIGGLYGVVTVPILRTIKAEVAASENRLRAELKGEIAMLRSDLKDTEHRLNERIDTRLVHR
jgi:hypothetical protein